MAQGNPLRQPANGSGAAGANPTERTVARLLRLAASLLLLLALGSVARSAWQGWTASHAPVAQETACPAPAEEAADSCALPGAGTPELATTALPPGRTPVPTPTPRAIRVVRASPVVEFVATEQYHLDNCEGIKEMRKSFSDAAQVWTEIAISDQATRSDGTVLSVSEPLRSALVHEVELAYQESLAAARAVVEQSEMVAGAQTRWNVSVIWEDRIFAASISFPSDSMTAMAAYTYTQRVPRMGYVQPLPCTT